jgi:hypothetical protein
MLLNEPYWICWGWFKRYENLCFPFRIVYIRLILKLIIWLIKAWPLISLNLFFFLFFFLLLLLLLYYILLLIFTVYFQRPTITIITDILLLFPLLSILIGIYRTQTQKSKHTNGRPSPTSLILRSIPQRRSLLFIIDVIIVCNFEYSFSNNFILMNGYLFNKSLLL